MGFGLGLGSPSLGPAGGEQYRLAAHIETCNVMGVDGEALPVRLADHNAVQRGERGQLQAGQVDPFRVAMERAVEIGAGIGYHVDAADLEGGAVIVERRRRLARPIRSEEHTSELQSLMRISYAVFCLKKKKHNHPNQT